MVFGMAFFLETLRLDSSERIVSVVRSHPFPMIRALIVPVILLSLFFLFLFPLFAHGFAGVLVFVAGSILAALMIIRTLIRWYGSVVVLTSRRILRIDRQGFLKKQVREFLLENIQELSYQTRGAFQTSYSFGDISIVIFAQATPVIFSNIPQPQYVLDLISHERSRVQSQLSPSQLASKLDPVADVQERGVSM